MKMKEKIEETKEKLTKAEAEKKVLMGTLENDFGVKTIKKAKAKLESMEAESQELNDKIEAKVEELEERFRL